MIIWYQWTRYVLSRRTSFFGHLLSPVFQSSYNNFPVFQMKNKYRVYVYLELTGQTSVLYNYSYFPNGKIKLCLTKLPLNTSFESIHTLANRATPTQMSAYKHAIQLYKLYNSNDMSEDWISLNIQQNFNDRNGKFQSYNIENYKVGKNLLCNRFKQLNNKIDYHWFNESLNSYKIKCKKLLL